MCELAPNLRQSNMILEAQGKLTPHARGRERDATDQPEVQLPGGGGKALRTQAATCHRRETAKSPVAENGREESGGRKREESPAAKRPIRAR